MRRVTGLLEEATQALRRLRRRVWSVATSISTGGSRRWINGQCPAQAQARPDMIGTAGVLHRSGRHKCAISQRSRERSQLTVLPTRRCASETSTTLFWPSRNFLSNYPFGRYAPNAHYWLGELYLVVEPPDPELARQNFKLLLDQYSADPKVPDALYKLGRVQFIKGNRDSDRGNTLTKSFRSTLPCRRAVGEGNSCSKIFNRQFGTYWRLMGLVFLPCSVGIRAFPVSGR